MTVRAIKTATGKTFKLGRRAPVAIHPHLKFKNYLLRGLPDPPGTLDLTAKAMPSLNRMMLNDTLGCCEIAWYFGHARGVWTGNAAKLEITSDDWIKKLYSVIGGYVDGDPSTDNGCQTQDVLAYLMRTGEAVGTLGVNAADATELRLAIYLFGGVGFGVGLPDAWIKALPNINWDVAGPPDQANGHCFGCPSKYDASTVATSTWGQIGSLTDAAAAKYCTASGGGECFAVLSPWWVDTVSKLAPVGFNIAQLQAHLQALA